MLIEYLKRIPDKRRGQGKTYKLHEILFFSILAKLCGANSYHGIKRFINTHFLKLCDLFNLRWTKPPCYGTIRGVLQQTDVNELEKVFRQYSKDLLEMSGKKGGKYLAIDGKTLRGSFDNFVDQKAVHLLSVFDTGVDLILGHYETDEKSNEIPAAQEFLKEIGLSGYIMTMDALHCQKNS
jgi:hypothetical protein